MQSKQNFLYKLLQLGSIFSKLLNKTEVTLFRNRVAKFQIFSLFLIEAPI